MIRNCLVRNNNFVVAVTDLKENTNAKTKSHHTSTMNNNPRYEIVPEILPDYHGPSDIQRLRAFLKSALRQWGIKNQGLEPDNSLKGPKPCTENEP